MKKTGKILLSLVLALVMVLSVADMSNIAEALTGYSATSRATSKKGIQLTGPHLYYQAVELGCSSIFVNLKISDLIQETYSGATGDNVYTYGGKTYSIDTWVMQSYIDNFQRAKNAGIEKIYVAVYSGKVPGLTYDKEKAGAYYYAFNTMTSTGKAIVEKVFEYICKSIGKNVDYWMVSSEINDQHQYYEMGTSDLDYYVKNYEAAMRILNNKAKKYNSKASTLVCIDHEWTSAAQGRFNSKLLLQKVAAVTKSNNYDWGVAIHPYPEPLYSANFWNDEENNATNDPNTHRITMDNLNVMDDFMQSSEMLYNGKVRSYAITETGFNAYENGKEDETLQAAAYAYAYYKAAADPLIDTFIFRCYTDEAPEVAQGFYYGITRPDGSRRKVYDVVKFIDTTFGEEFTKPYLNYFNIKSWSELVPTYSTIKHTKSPLTVLGSISSKAVAAGDSLTISAKVYGNKGTTKYQYEYEVDGVGTVIMKTYTSANSVTVKVPVDKPGRIVIRAKDGEGRETTDSIAISSVPSKSDKTSGLKDVGGTKYYFHNGAIDFAYSGLCKSSDGKTYYVRGGVVEPGKTGIVFDKDGTGYYIENSVVSKNIRDGLYQNMLDWDYHYYMMKNGVVDTSYTRIVFDNSYYYPNITCFDKGRQLDWGEAFAVDMRDSKYTLKVEGADGYVVRFESYNNKVAEVTKTGGLIKPKHEGTVEINIGVYRKVTDWYGNPNEEYVLSKTVYADIIFPFEDVAYDYWGREAIGDMAIKGIINGKSDTEFAPSDKVTRGQIVTMLWNMAGHPSVKLTKNPFPDVPVSKYYAQAVAWAKETGIVSGYKDGTFGATDNVTRQDIISMLRNFAKYKSKDVSIKNVYSFRACKDWSKVSTYAEKAMAWGYERGFIGSNRTLNPKGNASRAETASMLQRFVKYYGF